MYNIINFQNIQINVIDVDTKKLIQEDFTVLLYPIDANYATTSNRVIHRTIKGENDTLCNVPVCDNFMNISFDSAPGFHERGYEIVDDSNYIQFEYVEEIGAFMAP